RDITEQKESEQVRIAVERAKAEEALKESESKYHMLFEATNDGFWWVDKHGYIIETNSGLPEMLGYDKEELVGKLWPGFVDDEWLDKVNKEWEAQKSGKSNRYEIKLKRKDKSSIWAQVNGLSIMDKDGEYTGTLEAFKDITEQKNAENALRKSEEKFRALFDNTVYAFLLEEPIFDENGNVIDVRFLEINPAFEKQTGYMVEDFLGRTAMEVIPHVGSQWIEEFDRAFKSAQPVETVYYGSETERWYEKIIFPFSTGLLSEQFIDITERKCIEDALRESEQKANMMVVELEEIGKNKNEFINMLSHELRNPLATLTSGITLLKHTSKNEKQSSTIKVLERQTEHLSKLVDDLLDITRINHKKIILKKETVNLNTIVEDSIVDIKPQFEEKGIRLIEDMCKEPITVHVDSLRIAQCIGNILRNALKFTEEKGIVNVSLKREGENAVINVQDNGIGISHETLTNIFEPFKQDYNPLSSYNNMGLGLGLAIVKEYMEMHHGDVSASSPGVGKGSTFTLRLPIADK
ncbi:MAG: PAS domain S-box protein, partial [Clostridiales bacterium]|nr:PAS domain S-box protein [Clostridiales bacterium]